MVFSLGVSVVHSPYHGEKRFMTTGVRNLGGCFMCKLPRVHKTLGGYYDIKAGQQRCCSCLPSVMPPPPQGPHPPMDDIYLPSMQSLGGTMFGAVLSFFLLGVLTIQLVTYFRRFPHDMTALKIIVASLGFVCLTPSQTYYPESARQNNRIRSLWTSSSYCLRNRCFTMGQSRCSARPSAELLSVLAHCQCDHGHYSSGRPLSFNYSF